MPKNLIIFDIDGTVANSGKQHGDSIDYGFEKTGCHEVNRNWNSYDHVTDFHVYSKIFEVNHKRKATFEDIDYFQQHVVERLQQLPTIEEIPGAVNFIQKVWYSEKWDLAFATGSLYETALKKLGDPGIKYKAGIVIASNRIETREGLIHAAEDAAKRMFQVNNYEHILSCGDALWDVKTAHNLNLPLLGVGLDHKEELLEAGVKHHIDNWTNVSISDLDTFLN